MKTYKLAKAHSTMCGIDVYFIGENEKSVLDVLDAYKSFIYDENSDYTIYENLAKEKNVLIYDDETYNITFANTEDNYTLLIVDCCWNSPKAYICKTIDTWTDHF